LAPFVFVNYFSNETHFIEGNMYVPSNCKAYDEEKTQRKHCKVCYGKGKRKDSVYYCPQCPGNPGLWNHVLDNFFSESKYFSS
jgi:hypothetical protein